MKQDHSNTLNILEDVELQKDEKLAFYSKDLNLSFERLLKGSGEIRNKAQSDMIFDVSAQREVILSYLHELSDQERKIYEEALKIIK